MPALTTCPTFFITEVKVLALYDTHVFPPSEPVALSLESLDIGGTQQLGRPFDSLLVPTITSLRLFIALDEVQQHYLISILEQVAANLHHLCIELGDEPINDDESPAPPQSLLRALERATNLKSFGVLLSDRSNLLPVVSTLRCSLVILTTGGTYRIGDPEEEVVRARLYLKLLELQALKKLRRWKAEDMVFDPPREDDAGQWVAKCLERGIEVQLDERFKYGLILRSLSFTRTATEALMHHSSPSERLEQWRWSFRLTCDEHLS